MPCPICQSNRFYVKDPSDPFEIYGFKYQEGNINFDDAASETEAPTVDSDQEIYCQRCSWHGKVHSVT